MKEESGGKFGFAAENKLENHRSSVGVRTLKSRMTATVKGCSHGILDVSQFSLQGKNIRHERLASVGEYRQASQTWACVGLDSLCHPDQGIYRSHERACGVQHPRFIHGRIHFMCQSIDPVGARVGIIAGLKSTLTRGSLFE